MTPSQIYTVAALGGLTVLLGLILFVVASIGVFVAITHLADAHQDRRQRRQTIADYRRELDALPTTTDPKEQPRHDHKP